MSRDKLKDAIIENSINENREEAKEEREFINFYLEPKHTNCLCGQNIVEACELQNKNNKKIVIVGNNCVRNFFHEDFDYIFKSLRKIKQDINKSVDENLIYYAYDKGWIDETDKKQYICFIKKRKPLQIWIEQRVKVNKLLLQKFNKEM